MRKSVIKKISVAVAGAMLVSMASVITPAVNASATEDTYKSRFMEMYSKIHDSSNGYFSSLGIPYHSVETLMCEAPDYGHETTSEAYSYYAWLESMYDSFTGNWDSFKTAWDSLEKYMIPSDKDQLESSMSKYNASKVAGYIPEGDLPSDYPGKLDQGAPVGSDPINADLVSTYKTNLMYGMHWLLDVDNWYGFGSREDGTTSPSYINTFQRGCQESVWETVPQPCWEAFKYGGKNGYLDLFTDDSSYSKQFKYTDAPDADARLIQATYDAALWSSDNGASITDKISNASKMGDYLRYAMFDKYFRKIGSPSTAGTGYDACHYLLSWYYAWGGSTDPNSGWAWKIGSSHVHFGYQNPMTAWILSNDSTFKPKSSNGATDWGKSLTRQLELYQWLQSKEGGIAGGCSNSNGGRYLAWDSSVNTFYGMGYQEHPVYHDPGSNRWFGMQTWSMQRLAEYYYTTKNATAGKILAKWIPWAEKNILLYDDGTFAIPSNLSWSGQPDTWTGTAPANDNLSVSVDTYSTDLGVASSLANTLSYYAAATNDATAQDYAKELLDRIYSNYTDSKGVSVSEAREDYSRFADPVYIPSGWTGTMPSGDAINSNSTFISLRTKYKSDPDWTKVESYLNGGAVPTFKYHRFWAQSEFAIANGVYSKLFGTPSTEVNSSITPTTATFDKAEGNQADVTVTMTTNGNTFEGIKNGSTSLVEGTDYTVDGDTVTIKSSYLANQDTGTTNLSFVFSEGKEPTLSITITDSSAPTPVQPVTGDLEVQMCNSSTQASTNGITPHFKLINNGSTAIDLSNVTLRYYFTKDGAQNQTFWCDWSPVGSSNVSGKFVSMGSATDTADTYLEVGFSSAAGSLAPGANIEVQGRFSNNDWSNFTQSNDYSFDSLDSSYADWTKVTAYENGTLVWGLEPAGTTTPATIKSLAAATATTTAGTAPVLPGKVAATYSDGTTAQVAVTWDSIPASDYASAGTFTVSGTVAGTSLKATCAVTVSAAPATKTITALEDTTATTVAGTAPTLPSTVKATYSDDTTAQVAVTWDSIPASDYAAAGTFTVSGTVAGTDLKATCTVTVTAKSTPIVTNGNVEVQMFNGNTQTTTNGIAPRFKFTNTGDTAIDLSNLTLRYYYTEDGTQSQSFWCDWSSVGSGNVVGTFNNGYLEISFTSAAGTLAPGASIEVQGRFSKSDWSNYDQSNDYSFNASGTGYTDWNKVTVYDDGTLIWGVEP